MRNSISTSRLGPFDTDGDNTLAPLDILYGINSLNEKGARRLTEEDLRIDGAVRYLDVNGDGFHSPSDVLQQINQLELVAREEAAVGSTNQLQPVTDQAAAETEIRVAVYEDLFQLDRYWDAGQGDLTRLPSEKYFFVGFLDESGKYIDAPAELIDQLDEKDVILAPVSEAEISIDARHRETGEMGVIFFQRSIDWIS